MRPEGLGRASAVPVTRGVTAALALLAAVAGVPLVLAVWAGNPLPNSLPGLDEASRALTEGRISDRTLIKILAATCWLLWAQFVVAVALEVLAAWRGWSTDRVPAVPVARRAATALVAAVGLLAAAHARPLVSERLPAPSAPKHVPRVEDVDRETPEITSPEPALPVHVVRRRETLWGIAEEHLGDPLRWEEIVALNRDREQPSGHRLTGAHDQLRAGWTLLLPPDATGVSGVSDTADAADTADAPRSENGAGAAPVPTRPENPEPVNQNPEPASTASPEALAKARDAARGIEAVALEATEALARLDRSLGLEAEPEALRAGWADSPAGRTGGFAGAGMLAAGVVWTLERMRSRQERWRRAGRRIRLADPDAVAYESRLRATAETGLADFVDLALRAFALRVARAGRVPRSVVGVNVADEVSLLFGAPQPEAVEGFTVEDDGYSWVMGSGQDVSGLEGSTAGVIAPLPALFTLGHTGQSQVLLNPEHTELIAVTGASLHVQELLFSAAAEIATGPWSPQVRLITCGFGHELVELPGVEVVDSLADVLPAIEDAAEGSRAASARSGYSTALEARANGDVGDVWKPTLVMVAHHEPEELERLTVATGAPGVCAVVVGPVEAARWTIEVTRERTHLEPVGVDLARHRLGETERRALRDLLRTAADTEGTEAGPPSASVGKGVPLVESDSVPNLEIQVLGPVRITGITGEITRRKALELVAYLAVHPRGAEAGVLWEALWPGKPFNPNTLHTVASIARRALGVTAEGAARLPHVGPDGLYRLDPTVAVDEQRFRALVQRVSNQADDDAPALMESALRLVRGRPFSAAGPEYIWAHAEALTSTLVAEIADTAHCLATLSLDRGDTRTAWWATSQGLLASPGNEQLHRDRMFAADQDGNPDGVEQVMRELCQAIDIEGSEIRDVLHPQTLAVYEQLRRRSPTAIAGDMAVIGS